MKYMFCDGKAQALEAEAFARARVPEVLEEFERYFNTGHQVGISVKAGFHGVWWSVTADLLFGGELVRHYESFDLLELDLLHMEIGAIRMSTKGGII